jgi:hypothetical protein
MKNMKRLIAVMMVLTLALCFVACTEPQQNPGASSSEKPAPSSTTSEPTSSSTQKEEDPEPSHIVKVVDQDGNPVAGVYVQLCDNGSCYAPVVTNEEGIAEFFKPGITGAMTKVMKADGYTFSNEYTNFAEGENTVTLTITKNAE